MFYELGLSTMDYLLTPPAIRANMMSPACQVVIIIIVIIFAAFIKAIINIFAAIIIVIVITIFIMTGVSNSDFLSVPNRVFDRYSQHTKTQIKSKSI